MISLFFRRDSIGFLLSRQEGKGGLFYRDQRIECQEVAEGEGGATAAQADVRPASSTLFFASPTHIDRPKTHFLQHTSNIIISDRSSLDRQRSSYATHAQVHMHTHAFCLSLSRSLILFFSSCSLSFSLYLSRFLSLSLFLSRAHSTPNVIHTRTFFFSFFICF